MIVACPKCDTCFRSPAEAGGSVKARCGKCNALFSMVPVGSAFQVVAAAGDARRPAVAPSPPPVQMAIGLDDPTLAPKVEKSAVNLDAGSTQVLSYSVVADALGEELPVNGGEAAVPVGSDTDPAAVAAPAVVAPVKEPVEAPAPSAPAASGPAVDVGSSTVMATPEELGIELPEPAAPASGEADLKSAPETAPDTAPATAPQVADKKTRKKVAGKKARAAKAAPQSAEAAAAARPSSRLLSSLGNILVGVFSFVGGFGGGYAAAQHLQQDYVTWAPAGGFIALAIVALVQLVWKRRKR